MNNECHELSAILDEIPSNRPIITNGLIIEVILDERILAFTNYLPTEQIYYLDQKCFPKDNNLNVHAATIDILTSIYFSVTLDGNNSKICSHPYTRAPDSYLFGLKMSQNLHDGSLEGSLLKHLLPCAFSPTIPENLISTSENIEKELNHIIKWIDKNTSNCILVKGLLLLLDLNLNKVRL